MSDRPICNATDHLFVPMLEVSAPLLRCVRCDVFAYHDTVKQLARHRRSEPETALNRAPVAVPMPYWRRMWLSLRRNFGAA
jgi:hypothetical protein